MIKRCPDCAFWFLVAVSIVVFLIVLHVAGLV
jgi:hypothetical protein